MTTHRVLVVDDDASARVAIAADISALGHEAVPAETGEEALELMARGQGWYHLVLSKIGMPEMDGITLMQRTHRSFPDLPVALMAGETDFARGVEAVRQSAFDFLCKPFGQRELAETLGRLPRGVHLLDLVYREQTANFREELSLTIPSKRRIASDVIAYIRGHYSRVHESMGINPHNVILCLTEALNNAIVHGNFGISSQLKDEDESWEQFRALLEAREADPRYANRMVDLRYVSTPEQVEIEVRDEGRGFDHAAALKRDVFSLHSHGRGLLLMRELVDQLEFNRAGNQVRFRLQASG